MRLVALPWQYKAVLFISVLLLLYQVVLHRHDICRKIGPNSVCESVSAWEGAPGQESDDATVAAAAADAAAAAQRDTTHFEYKFMPQSWLHLAGLAVATLLLHLLCPLASSLICSRHPLASNKADEHIVRALSQPPLFCSL